MLFCKAVPQDFPTPFPLNGADYFLHALDSIMRDNLGRGNRCHFVISLEGGLEFKHMVQIVADIPHLSALCNLAYHRAPTTRYSTCMAVPRTDLLKPSP